MRQSKLFRLFLVIIGLFMLLLQGEVGKPQNKIFALTPSSVIKVLVLNLDPIIEIKKSKRLHQIGKLYGRSWNDPRIIAKECIADMKESSGNQIIFEIVEWQDLDEFPRAEDGFQYDDVSYINTYEEACSKTQRYWEYNKWHKPNGFDFDYSYYINKYNLPQRIQDNEIDEVWIFGGPCLGVGFYESQMVGSNAFWCSSPPIVRNDCKPFVIMFFNYEREVGCMLEDFGHRMEAIMAHVFGRWDLKVSLDIMNKWERFTLYDKISPGNAACGTIHFAPNSNVDYDWGNTKKVWTSYVDWLNYPNFTGKKTYTNCTNWGGGDMRLHHKWWFNCIPRADGKDEDEYFNNWWLYFIANGNKQSI